MKEYSDLVVKRDLPTETLKKSLISVSKLLFNRYYTILSSMCRKLGMLRTFRK